MKVMGIFRNNKRHTIAILLGLSLTVTAAIPAIPTTSYAAVPKLDQIRVALFIDFGKSYKAVVPTVTLSSDKGLELGLRHPGGINPWVTAPAGVPVRASVDRYKVMLAETPDYTFAETIAKALQTTQDKPYVFKSLKQGKVVYRVYAGMYNSMQLASDAAQRIANGASTGVLLKGIVPSVAGSYYASAGTFATEALAKPILDSLLQNGLEANLTVQEQAGVPVYAVWVGDAADDTQLDVSMQQAAKLGIPLQKVDRTQPYLLKREEVTPGLVGITPSRGADHYSFNGSDSGQKVWVSTKDSTILVEERSKRKYRGSMELSEFNGSLAVINEVPFEAYLVSVVGTEMNNKWPAEALKAQAVAARTFAIKQGMKYQIAHISDSTTDQAYYGTGVEGEATAAAVQATAGELILHKGAPISPFYYSNGGGMTGDAVEVWGQVVDYIAAVPSPDEGAAANELDWYRVVLADGTIGYIRSDYATDTGMKSPAGLRIAVANESGVAIRPAPYVDNVKNEAITKVNKGDRMTIIGQDLESNEFAWIRGPFTGSKLLETINNTIPTPVTGPLQSLEVSKRGPSGRVTELTANGKAIPLTRPDNYRTALNGAPSTRFEIEETAKLTVLGADGKQSQLNGTQGTVYALTGESASTSKPIQPSKGTYYVTNHIGAVRPVTADPQYRLIGKGFGHGLGMSQWGARGLA